MERPFTGTYMSCRASDAILRLAHDTAAGLIAVGSHSYSLFERLLLGSVASRIVRGAECAVLVAPAAQVPSVLRDNVIESELLAHLGHRGSVASHGRNGLETALSHQAL